MDINRYKLVIVFLFMITIYFYILPLSVNAASRGITVIAKTSSGMTKEIRLYSGYYALVVGCGDYRSGWPKLPNPVKDAREVATTLKNMGWKVDVLENPEGRFFRRKLNQLIVGPGRDKNKGILLWFSGHGYTLKEADGLSLGYLVPIDAPDPEKDEIGFMEKAVSMRYIETVAKRIQAKHVLMAFDSCFSGAIFQMIRAKPSAYIQEKVAEPVRQFITAGNETEQVPDRSVFKDVFIQGIHKGYADRNSDGYVTGEELGSYLQEKVVNYFRKAQHPQFGKINNPKLDKGDFVFLLASSGAVVEESPPKAPLKGHLYVNTQPDNTKVRILNIGPKFYQGMELDAGRYHVEVSADGYETKKLWITLGSGEDRSIDVRLQKRAVAPSSSYISAKEIKRDGNFIAYSNGVVYDKNTGLEWLAGPDRRTNWNEAKAWVENLTVAGGGWRMPTRNELRALYKKGAGSRNMTPLLQTTGWWVWSGETHGSSSKAWIFSFDFVDLYLRNRTNSHVSFRSFAVRSRRYPKYSSISPKTQRPKEIARDGRFIAYNNGTVKDTKTGLMWAAKDNGKDINWDDAKKYCENYRGGGYTDWRMPAIDELEGLTDKNGSYGVHKTKLIKLTSCCLWASNMRGSEDAFLLFGDTRDWISQTKSNTLRALPVRGSTGSDLKVSAFDGRFVAYFNGVVYDKRTGLEGFAGPDRNTKWWEAKAWVDGLNVAGGGWRMPTINELKTLYQKGAGTNNMTPLLKGTGRWVWVWSGETSNKYSAWFFLFNKGDKYLHHGYYSDWKRGFAVRSRKK